MQPAGVFLPGRANSLAKQFDAARCFLVGTLETRVPHDGWAQYGPYHVLHAAASTRGQYGVSLWIHTRLEYSPGRRLQPHHVRVLASDHRWMVVALRAPELAVNVLVAHAPHARTPNVDLSRWWSDMTVRAVELDRHVPLISLIDANATLGSVVSAHVGQVAAEPENYSGECFHRFLRSTSQFAPATFSDSATGLQGTWAAPSATEDAPRRRIDYVTLSTSMRSAVTSHGVDATIDLSILRDDHFVAYVETQLPVATTVVEAHAWARPGHDPAKYGDPECCRAFQARLSELPQPGYGTHPDDHAKILEDHLHDALCSAFPLAPPNQRRTPKQAWLSDPTLDWVERRSLGRRDFRWLQRTVQRTLLALTFLGWTSVLSCGEWYNHRTLRWTHTSGRALSTRVFWKQVHVAHLAPTQCLQSIEYFAWYVIDCAPQYNVRAIVPFTPDQARAIVRLACFPDELPHRCCPWPRPAEGTPYDVQGLGRRSSAWQAMAHALERIHQQLSSVAVHGATHVDSIRHCEALSRSLRDAWDKRASPRRSFQGSSRHGRLLQKAPIRTRVTHSEFAGWVSGPRRPRSGAPLDAALRPGGHGCCY